MKVKPLLTGVLLGSAASTANRAEAKTPLRSCASSVSRGLGTGSLSTGLKSLAADLLEAAKSSPSAEQELVFDEKPLRPVKQRAMTQIAANTLKEFPVSFGANALATCFVDKLFCVSPKQTVNSIRQLPFPLLSMGLTKQMLSNTRLPQPAKEVAAYGAFWAAGLVQGKSPVHSALAISGFAVGTKVAKGFIQKREKAIGETAASGFLAPDSSRVPSKAKPQSYEQFIKSRYGLSEGEKFWEGPDGSIFLPHKPSGV